MICKRAKELPFGDVCLNCPHQKPHTIGKLCLDDKNNICETSCEEELIDIVKNIVKGEDK